jgi:hypothetical protein
MIDRDLSAQLDHLAARQAATEQSLLELAEVLQTVARHLREMPNLDVMGRSEIGAVGHVLRQITLRHQASE